MKLSGADRLGARGPPPQEGWRGWVRRRNSSIPGPVLGGERSTKADRLDTAPAADPRQLHEQIDRMSDIMPHVGPAEVRCSIKHEKSELLDCGFGGIRVDGGHRSRVPRVHGAQKRERFGSPKFAQNDA